MKVLTNSGVIRFQGQPQCKSLAILLWVCAQQSHECVSTVLVSGSTSV